MPRGSVLRPETPVLRRAPGELQFGTDPRWSVRLVGLEPDEERWLLGLSRSPATSPRRGPATSRQEALLGLLDEARLLVPRRRQAVTPAPGNGAADLDVLSAVRPDGAGQRVLAARARAVVAVVGLGRIGASLATILATAGVGTLDLRDPAPVLVADVGLGAFRLRDVGTAREAAVRRVAGEVAPGVELPSPAEETRTEGHQGAPATRAPDVVVVVEHGAADAQSFRRLVGEGVAHLSIVVREADVLVGPFVRPGLGPCLTCVDLHRTDVDPSWPQVAQQLRESARPAREESVLAATAAALAAGQVLAALDGAVPRAATACIEIPAPDAVPRLRETGRHPRCGCVEIARTPPDGAPLTMSRRPPRFVDAD